MNSKLYENDIETPTHLPQTKKAYVCMCVYIDAWFFPIKIAFYERKVQFCFTGYQDYTAIVNTIFVATFVVESSQVKTAKFTKSVQEVRERVLRIVSVQF